MFGDQQYNFTLVSATDIPRYHIVVGSGVSYGGLGVSPTAARLVGVAQNAPLSGEHVGVCPIGISRVMVSSIVAAYDSITCSTSGRAMKALSGDTIIGYAMEAGVLNDTIKCWINVTGLQGIG